MQPVCRGMRALWRLQSLQSVRGGAVRCGCRLHGAGRCRRLQPVQSVRRGQSLWRVQSLQSVRCVQPMRSRLQSVQSVQSVRRGQPLQSVRRV